ncbi:hypothetical protein LEP1GSC051_2070 [Leptospira sp. P2653]|nr:hypothetical protein LEP1GSC051_2070 [Leptospira sp. P2653]
MRLFTCKKYDFLIEKNLPSLSTYFATLRERNRVYSPPPKIRGNSGTKLPKLSKHLPMGRCLGRVVGTKFQRGFVGIPTDLSSDPSICG